MSVECTSADCANWTSEYLCGQCARDLQAWLDKIPVLIAALNVTIAKLDHVRSNGGGGGSKPGSAAPLNLDALQLQENLRTVRADAQTYAHDDRAAGLAWLIQDWVTKAELLVSGPQETPINHALNRERIRDIAPAMPTRELIPWLKTKAGIVITSMDIRNWARRGKLTPAKLHPQPAYHPHDVIDVWHETRKELSR